MSTRRARSRPPSTPSPSSSLRRRPPSPSSPSRKRRHRRPSARGYTEKPGTRIDLLLCVFHGAGSHRWRTAMYEFDRRRADDREVWEGIRGVWRGELQGVWRRVVGIKKVVGLRAVEYTTNGVPIAHTSSSSSSTNSSSINNPTPNPHSYLHALHHPSHIRSAHEWIDFFATLKASHPHKTIGLEFVEGLWAEKLAGVAIVATVAIVVTSIVWVVRGGGLQTVFTVMGFVLSGVAAEIALVALYYQVTLSN